MRPAVRPAAALSAPLPGKRSVELGDAGDALVELGLEVLDEGLDAGLGDLGLRHDVLARRRGLLLEVATERLDLALDAVAARAQRALDLGAVLANLALEAVARRAATAARRAAPVAVLRGDVGLDRKALAPGVSWVDE